MEAKNFIKSDNNNKELYSNNFNVIMNYEAFSKNKDIIDTYLQQIKDKLNNVHSENIDFERMSDNYIDILNDFSEINLSVDCEQIKEDSMNKRIKKLPNFPKIEKMKKLKLPLKSEAKCFSSLNKEKYIVLGLANGAIEIYEFAKQDSFFPSLHSSCSHQDSCGFRQTLSSLKAPPRTRKRLSSIV